MSSTPPEPRPPQPAALSRRLGWWDTCLGVLLSHHLLVHGPCRSPSVSLEHPEPPLANLQVARARHCVVQEPGARHGVGVHAFALCCSSTKAKWFRHQDGNQTLFWLLHSQRQGRAGLCSAVRQCLGGWAGSGGTWSCPRSGHTQSSRMGNHKASERAPTGEEKSHQRGRRG